jgi:hypothetical protein
MTPDEYAREKAQVLKEMSVKEAEINSKTP